MKKLFFALVSVVILLSAGINSFAAWTGYGDLNGDVKVNSSDALMVLMYSVGLTDFDADQKEAADVDANRKINSGDALMILQYSVGLIDAFTAEIGGDPEIGHGIFD